MREKLVIRIIILVIIAVATILALASDSVGNNITGDAREPRSIVEMYTFNGGNSYIEINDGRIILANGHEQFIGGNLVMKGAEPAKVEFYTTQYYFLLDGVKYTFNSDTVIMAGSHEGIDIDASMGSIRADELFDAHTWDIIKNSLQFSLSGRLVTGEDFEYNIDLEVTRV